MGHDLMTIQTQLKALRGVKRASRLDSPHAAKILQTTRPFLIHKVTAGAGRLSPVSSDMTSSTRGDVVPTRLGGRSLCRRQGQRRLEDGKSL